MPTLNSGERRFLNLDAGKVLTISVDAVSSAILRAYPTIQGGESTGQTLVAVGAPVIRGPYTAPTRWCIESTGSGVSYSVADNTGPDVVVDASGNPSANGALVSGAGGTPILSAASAGADSGWVTYVPGMRLAYALDSGSTSTTFSVDISNDGSASLGQAFTGTWAATTAEISPPLYLTNTQARYIRFNVLTGGPLSAIRF